MWDRKTNIWEDAARVEAAQTRQLEGQSANKDKDKEWNLHTGLSKQHHKF